MGRQGSKTCILQGFRVKTSGFRVQNLHFSKGLGSKSLVLRSKTCTLQGFRIKNFGFWVQDLQLSRGRVPNPWVEGPRPAFCKGFKSKTMGFRCKTCTFQGLRVYKWNASPIETLWLKHREVHSNRWTMKGCISRNEKGTLGGWDVNM